MASGNEKRSTPNARKHDFSDAPDLFEELGLEICGENDCDARIPKDCVGLAAKFCKDHRSDAKAREAHQPVIRTHRLKAKNQKDVHRILG